MFAKLLKHELRSTGAVMGVLSLAALGAGVLGTVILRIFVNYGDAMMESDSATVLVPIILIFAMVAVALGLVAYSIGGSLFVLIRFYRHKFTDEGYLTFTLPVNAHQIFLSSWVAMLIWNAVIYLVLYVCILSMILIGSATESLFNREIVDVFFSEFGFVFAEAWSEVWEAAGVSLVFAVIGAIVQVLVMPILTMTSIVLGAAVAKKHKMLAALGFNYAISTGTSMLISIVTSVSAVASLLGESTDTFLSVSFILQPMIYLGVGLGAYFLSVHLMGKKLNLP